MRVNWPHFKPRRVCRQVLLLASRRCHCAGFLTKALGCLGQTGRISMWSDIAASQGGNICNASHCHSSHCGYVRMAPFPRPGA